MSELRKGEIVYSLVSNAEEAAPVKKSTVLVGFGPESSIVYLDEHSEPAGLGIELISPIPTLMDSVDVFTPSEIVQELEEMPEGLQILAECLKNAAKRRQLSRLMAASVIETTKGYNIIEKIKEMNSYPVKYDADNYKEKFSYPERVGDSLSDKGKLIDPKPRLFGRHD